MGSRNSRRWGYALTALAVIASGISVFGPQSFPGREPTFTGATAWNIDLDGTITEITDSDLVAETTFEDPPPLRASAVVREFHAEEGWGVLDAAEIPGGCWVFYSEIVATGYRVLTPGQLVDLEYEDLVAQYGSDAHQDGYRYRATSVHP